MRALRVAWWMVMAAGLGAQVPAQLGWSQFCRRLHEVDWLCRAPHPGERCVQFSSFDRRSASDPGVPELRYANDDRGHYLRVVERDGRHEHVMVDAHGPGCLARLWSANPTGLLHFDIDGERVWSVDFGALCRGAVDGVPSPLAAMRSRGGNVYLPVPFARHLTISAEAGDLYYLADVALYPAGTAVERFDPGWTVGAEVLQGLADEASPVTAAGVELRELRAAQVPVEEAFVVAGPGAVARVPAGRRIVGLVARVTAPVQMSAGELGPLLDRLLLVMRCGDEQTVRVPLASFFCGGSAWQPWRSHLMGIRADRSAWCRWPMPMPGGGEVALEVDGERGAEFDGVTCSLAGALAACPEGEELLFRADYHLGKAMPTRPFADHLVLDARGRGRFVGCSLLVRNPSRIWWGEGDEHVLVDGEAFPSWWGTGTEDYFGYAWCDPTPFAAPLHAQVLCQGPMNFGFTQLFRAQVGDNVPFQSALRFEFERWHWHQDLRVDYATVAYWYGAAGATAGLPAVPAYGERALPRLAGPQMLAVAGALEGERLEVKRCSGGVHQVQDVSIFGETFSGDEHRWWRDGRAGDQLVLAVPVAQAGRYRVRAAMVRADDFGIVQLSLHGRRLGEPFDGFAEQVGGSGPLDFGEVTLPAGEVELVLELVGRNPRAQPRMMVGLDYLLLEKVE